MRLTIIHECGQEIVVDEEPGSAISIVCECGQWWYMEIPEQEEVI